MSTQTYLRATAITALSTLAFAATISTANAQSSRYADVYNYESGQNCGQACVQAPAAPASTRYGSATVTPSYDAPAMQIAPGPVYVDCTQMGTCAPQATTVYTAPAQHYSQVQTYNAAPVNCPAGTTAQPDGTCLQGATGSYGGTTSSSLSRGVTLPTNYSSTEPLNCPAGTTAQADGTCMQTSSSYAVGSTSSYGSTSSTYSSTNSTMMPVNCPAGTTAQPDGTCMQGSAGSYSNSTVEIYTGDAQTTGPVYGYQNTGSYSASDYLPIRK